MNIALNLKKWKKLFPFLGCIFVSCYKIPPSSGYILVDAKIEDGEVSITNLQKKIESEFMFKKDKYLIRKIIFKSTDSSQDVYWEVNCLGFEDDPLMEPTKLPDIILYGKNPCLYYTNEIGPKTLPIDRDIHATLAIEGMDENNENSTKFTIQSIFNFSQL
ncbi:hypothetical protein PVT68_11605 [Microbulbifer bruguierae]|uniref:Lipoprotein n=1 Tax=Microbulbifer bruguierae TaxID=3029061 RepID=A0ABY8NAG5_9GAMM|nr:hypothetical protein [Microbulbifer bruguierae]WGL15414.1 hypothetical protein PVT68_11605 [Microbulbifer bruguierae]